MAKSPKLPRTAKKDRHVPLNALATEKAGALRPEDSVKKAGERMREQQARVWPVAKDRKLVGMIGDKNPDWELGAHGHDPETWRVGEIMKRKTVFCYEDDDCESAEKMMQEHGLQYLPVVDRQMRIVGIFSRDEVKRRVR